MSDQDLPAPLPPLTADELDVDPLSELGDPNCQRCLTPMRPDDCALAWRCPTCGMVRI